MADNFSRETLSRHREVMAVAEKKPTIDESCFIAPSANIMGSVAVGKKSSVWYGAVVKGDSHTVSIGSESVIKDLAMLTTGNGTISIGNNVVVGAGAVINGATVEDDAVIGAAATLGDGVVVGKGAFVAPGSNVEPGTSVPAGQVFGGNPAAVLRSLTEEEAAKLAAAQSAYVELSTYHQEELRKTALEIEQDKSDRKWDEERSQDYDAHIGILQHTPRAQVW